MARTPRSEISRARRGVSVREERRRVRSPVVNGPASASTAWIQHNGNHLGAPSEIMGLSLIPSSGVEVQPEVQSAWTLADGFQDVHQPMSKDLQPSGTDFDVLTLAELGATQRLESIDIGAANLQTVFPLEFGNQASESIRASPFQSDGSLASVVMSWGGGNPTSNVINAALIATPPTASDYDFSTSVCLGPEGLISPLPEILPLQEAEMVHMLDQLFPPEQDQSLENHYASALSPPKQLYQPDHLEGLMQMVNCDPPSHMPTNLSLLTPLAEMIHGHYAATHPQSFPFGHWHQQSPQQPLTDLDGFMQKQQLLGSAPFHSSPASNEPCAMEYAMECAMEYVMECAMEFAMEFALEYPAGYPPSPTSNHVIPVIVPNIVEAAPTVNMITPFDSLQAQSPATSALPNSVFIPNGSAAHSASENHDTNVAARRVTSAGRCRVPRNRPPQSRQASVGRPWLRQIRAAPTPDASPATTMNLAEAVLGRIETQRQKHMMLHPGG